MNNDLISRSELKKALKSNCDTLCNDKNTNWCEHCCPLNDFEDLIDNAPTVEAYTTEQVKELVDLNKKLSAERPHGEWVDHWNEGYVECPFCHKPITGGDLNFCVKCGADMRPKKKLQTPSCLTNPERQAELLERYKEE